MLHAVLAVDMSPNIRARCHICGANSGALCHARVCHGPLRPGPSPAETVVAEPGRGHPVVESSARHFHHSRLLARAPPVSFAAELSSRAHRLCAVSDPNCCPPPHQVSSGHCATVQEVSLSQLPVIQLQRRAREKEAAHLPHPRLRKSLRQNLAPESAPPVALGREAVRV